MSLLSLGPSDPADRTPVYSLRMLPPLTPELAARLERRLRLAANGKCLEWTGPLSTGYGRIKLQGKLYLVHRLVLQLNDDSQHVDHICGNRACANPRHLRVVRPADNARHRTKINRNNTSGFPGVSKDGVRWRAQVSSHGVVIRLGSFETPQAAHEAYIDWQRTNNPYFGVLS